MSSNPKKIWIIRNEGEEPGKVTVDFGKIQDLDDLKEFLFGPNEKTSYTVHFKDTKLIADAIIPMDTTANNPLMFHKVKLEQRPHQCTGRVDHTKFQPYHGGSGIEFHVDTSHCQFTSTPTYLTSLTGKGCHYRILGTSAIYAPTPTGFKVYLTYSDPTVTTQTMLQWAAQNQWALEWIGIENKPNGKKLI